MKKRVTIGLVMDTEFIKFLDANVQLSGLRDRDQLQPIDQLALLVLGEARGATLEQLQEEAITDDWRENLWVVPDARKVEEVADDEPLDAALLVPLFPLRSESRDGSSAS